MGDSENDKPFQIFRIKGIPTEETWPGITKLRNCNPTFVPSWHANGLCSQKKIMRARDAKGLEFLSVSDNRFCAILLTLFIVPKKENWLLTSSHHHLIET